MFSLIYAWINDWVNNREAGDLRRQHGHYDVIVMISRLIINEDLKHSPGDSFAGNSKWKRQDYVYGKGLCKNKQKQNKTEKPTIQDVK